MTCQAEYRTEHGVPVLTLFGELDLVACPELQRHVDRAMADSPCFVLDLLSVTYTESAPIGMLVKAHEHAQKTGGAMAILCCQESVLRIFTMAGVVAYLHLFGGLDEALVFLAPYCAGTPSV